MGFWDDHPLTKGNFVGEEEKKALIDEGVVFTVSKVTKGPSQWGERYTLTADIEGEERAIGFAEGSVQSRDRVFDDLAAYFAEGGEPIEGKLIRIKRSILFVSPDEDGTTE